MHGICMYVAQTGQIGALICEMALPVIEPDLASGRLILAIEQFTRIAMQFAQKTPQGGVIALTYEMIMIEENRPGF